MIIDDVFNLIGSFIEFVKFLVVYPLSVLYNNLVVGFSKMSDAILDVVESVLSMLVNCLEVVAWLPPQILATVGVMVALILVVILVRVIGKIIRLFYPSAVGE